MICFALLALPLLAEEIKPAPALGMENWNGFQLQRLVVEGRKGLVVLPKASAPGKPWIWRTEFFGHEPQGDLALLTNGFHVAYVDVQNLYGAPVALDCGPVPDCMIGSMPAPRKGIRDRVR